MRRSILLGQRSDNVPPPMPSAPEKYRVSVGNAVQKPFVKVLANQMKSDTLQTKATPGVCGVSSLVSLVSKPFKVPTGCEITEKTLEMRRVKTLGVSKNIKIIKPSDLSGLIKVSGMVSVPLEGYDEAEEEQLPTSLDLPPFEPLVLWTDPDDPDHKIEVIPELACKLRPHQREGVKFLFECTMGLRGFEGQGCILADDMGLGKTLMSITTMWTLLNQGFKKGETAVRKVIVACPTSLVGNWDNEIRKWVGDRCPTFAVKGDPKKMIKTFLQHRGKGVLIISYETQRLYNKMFESQMKASNMNMGGSCCDLLICDEAHKLKNAESGLAKSLISLPGRKRILLSGTPIQNELTEFYNMVNFCNPNVLGSLAEFRRKYERPILAAREPYATEAELNLANVLQKELSTIVNEFILKRGNILNAQHLPPKLVQFVCCRPTPLQLQLYNALLSSKEIRHVKEGKMSDTLNSIRQLINICSHPKLILDQYNKKLAANEEIGDDLRGLGAILSAQMSLNSKAAQPSGQVSTASKSAHRSGTQKHLSYAPINLLVDPELSGKMLVLYKMMQTMRILKPSERIVIVSNYTQTLDLIQCLCNQCQWPSLRLDGSVNSTRRTALVEEFNNPNSKSFAFLLSSKAGGCGINLIGGNRLVLFDPDWNPASDKQAAGRIWREGQKKRCYIYRFMSTGTIEEKIIQRQLSKEGLVDIVDDKEQVNCISTDELRQLFALRSLETSSDTHDTLKCKRCPICASNKSQQNGMSPGQISACAKVLDDFSASLIQESIAYQRREQKRAAEHIAHGESSDLAPLVNREMITALPFAEQIEKLKRNLEDKQFSNLTAYARKQRELFMDIEQEFQTARKINAGNEVENTEAIDLERVRILSTLLPPLYSVFGEFIKIWTDLVPSLVSLQSAVSTGETEQVIGENRGDSGGEAVEQIGCPDDTDLNSWSHHNNVLTCDDDLLCSAFADSEDSYISFVFGLEVNFSLLEMRERENKEEEERKKEEREQALRELNEKRNRKRQRAAEGREEETPEEGLTDYVGESKKGKNRAKQEQREKGDGTKKVKNAKKELTSDDESIMGASEGDEKRLSKQKRKGEVEKRMVGIADIFGDESDEEEVRKETEVVETNIDSHTKELTFQEDIICRDNDIKNLLQLYNTCKLKLQHGNFDQFWKVLKNKNNDWRSFLTDEGQEIFTRTSGCKKENYATQIGREGDLKYKHLIDYFVGVEEIVRFIVYQAKKFHAELGQYLEDMILLPLLGPSEHDRKPSPISLISPEQELTGTKKKKFLVDEGVRVAGKGESIGKKKRRISLESDDEGDVGKKPLTNNSLVTLGAKTLKGEDGGELEADAYFEEDDYFATQDVYNDNDKKPNAKSIKKVENILEESSQEQSGGLEQQVEWSCTKCTLLNSQRRKKCSLCNEVRKF